MIGKFIFDKKVIPENISVDYRSLGDTLKEFNQVTIRQRCKFFGSNYIFNDCTFNEFVIFDSSFNKFNNCTYMGQNMCNDYPVCVTNFQIADINGTPQQYTLVMIRMAVDIKDIVYIRNNTQNKVIRSYEDLPVEWNLHWKCGCIKHYVKAMKKNLIEIS